MDKSASSPLVERPGLILALICLPVFIGALDLTIVSAVLPHVLLELVIPIQTHGDDAAWMVSGYLLAYTISVALMGRVSDLIGRRRTYFVALLIFILGSWLVAVAMYTPAAWVRRLVILFSSERPDQSMMILYAIIIGRVIQALGAGAMVPVSMALVGDLYPAGKRAAALGLIGAVDTAGWVLGHLYGGIMVQYVKWPILFWINIPITVMVAWLTWRDLANIAHRNGENDLNRWTLIGTLISGGVVSLLALLAIFDAFAPDVITNLTNRLIRHSTLTMGISLVMLGAIVSTVITARRAEGAGKPDWIGALLLTISIAALSIGLGGESGVLPPSAYVLLSISVISLIAFVVYERWVEAPLVDLAYFRNRSISMAAIINLLVGFCLMVGLVSVPLFVNAVIATDADEGALVSGILLAGLTVPMALASIPGGMLANRFGYRVPTVAGLILAVAGFVLGRTWTPDVSQITIAWHLALAGIGLGLTIAPISTVVINAVRASERGFGAALVLIMRLIGMTFGTAIMTGYGLRRVNGLLESMIAAAGSSLDADTFVRIGREATTITINEMLVIAAIVCAAAILPAVYLPPRDAAPAEPD